MNSITSPGRIAIVFAIDLMFVAALLAQGTNYEGPVGVTGIFNGNVITGCSYDPLTHSAHRAIDDIVVPGSIGKYPLKMTRYYNSRQQYYAGGAIALSPGWAHEYSWIQQSANRLVSPHGTVYDPFCGAPVGVSESWEGNDWRLADGGRVHFDSITGRCTWIDDPYGQRTTITYSNNQISQVTEPGGRYLEFIYGPDTDPDGTEMLKTVEAHGLGNATVTDSVTYSYTLVSPVGTGREKLMLTKATYRDGKSATYTYRTDNVAENGTSLKLYPLVERCDDFRYNGPMRTIFYDYQNSGPHGAIIGEKYPGVGAVSAIDPGVPSEGYLDTFTETRGDGPSRSFTYTHMMHCQGPDCLPCDDYENNQAWPDRAPQQMLVNYTDFKNQTTELEYDPSWYVNKVIDARNKITLYARGSPPPIGIGQITKITHPDQTHIDYGYQDEQGSAIDGHYLTSITEYTPANVRRSQIIHSRDAITHKIYQTDYQDANLTLLARETFTYCDQTDPQCGPVNPTTGQMHGQIKTHKLKNGAYVHYRYDAGGRGLLVDKWEPTWNTTALDTDPKTHYTYYPDGEAGKNPWADRLKTMTLPANVSGNVASETYEYDVVSGTNPNDTPVAGRGLVTKITHADGKNKSFGYDAYGNKLWEENELRKRTSYTYDSYKRVLTIKDPIGQTTNRTTTYTYTPTNGGGGSSYLHTTNSPDTVTTPAGIMTTNVYDKNFRKTQSKVDGKTTWFNYDAVGNQDWVTDPRGTGSGDANYTTYTDYDSRNRKSQVREPLGRTTQFYYDDGFNITRIIRPDQTTETKVYDGMNRLKTDTVPKDTGVNIVTQFLYNPWSGDPADSGHSGSLLQKVIDGENHNYQFKYDAAGLKSQMTYHDGSSQSWAYDDAHNLESRTTVNNETQNFEYDIRNRKTKEWWDGWPPDGEWRAFGYDDASRLTLATNGLGAYWTNFIADVRRFYDAAGRLTLDRQTVYVNGVGNMRDVNYPSYDDDGKLLRMYVAGVSPAYDYTFTYDTMGRFEKITPTGSGIAFQYYYDPASNETQRYNWANHIAQNYVPDNLNRMLSVEVKNTITNTRLGIENYDYYPISRLRSVTREDNLQDSFTYHLDGELKVATYGAAPTPPPTATPTPPGPIATPTFNPDGTYYSACAFNYTFNVIISSATSNALIRYTTDGSIPTPTYGTPLANGGTASFTVPSLHTTTLKAIAYVGGTSSSVKSADYSFERDCGDGPMAYPLDMARIQSGRGPAAPNVSTVTYTLDEAGNRLSVNGTSYSPNSINQYTSVGGAAVTNGLNHEIKVYGGFTYYYMRDQELIKVTATGFTYDLGYDALGRCVRRIINNDPAYTTYYIYDGEKPILEYRLNGQIARNLYGKGVDEILMRTDPAVNANQAFYFQQDHEGSTTHLTNLNNGSGQIIERYRYDAFGLPTIYAPDWTVRTGSSYSNRFLFTGREYDGAWVYEYRARLYHSGLGRFMSEDPKLFDAGDYNLFRYCHNDPIDMTDPMGLVDSGDVKEFFYSLWYAGPRATFDAQSKIGDTSGKFAVQQGFHATRDYGANPNAGEAVRHEVWQSELARKWGEKAAKAIGDAHEKYKSHDPQDSKRDQYHNELGRDNAKTSQSREDSLQKARQDWESGRAARDKFVPRIEKSSGSRSDQRTQKTPDATTVEQRTIQQGDKKAQEMISNAEHGLNPKPQ